MKKVLIFSFLYMLCSYTYGQPRFNRIYRMFTVDSTGQQAATTFHSLRVVGNNIYTAGTAVRVVDSVITNSGIFTSYDMSGSMLKNTYFGVIPTNSDFNCDVILVEPNNQFSLAGFNFDYTYSFWKVDKDGNTQFKKKIIALDTSYLLGPPPNFVKLGDKYAFTSYASYLYRGYSNTIVYIVDSIGNIKRVVEFSHSEKLSHPTQILKNKNNNITISLYNTSNSSTDTNYVYISQLREIDTLGNTKWMYNTPKNRFIFIKKFAQLANGNYLAWGDEELSKTIGLYRNVTTVGPYLAEINPQRGLIWEKRFDLNTSSRMFGFKTLKDSSMILACGFSDGPGNTSACLIKLNKNRDSLYRRNFKATSITSDRVVHYPNQVEELDNGDLVIGGYVWDVRTLSTSATSGEWGWIVRTDSLGCSLQPSSCRTPTKETTEVPLSMIAYPNPTSGQLTIDFDKPSKYTEGSVNLFDLTGKTILSQKINNGQKQVVWQTEPLNQGLYFIILKVDNQVVYQTKVSVQK